MRWARGCEPLGKSQRRSLAGTFFGFPGGVRDRPRSPRPAVGEWGGVDGKPDWAFSSFGEFSVPCVLRDPRLPPPPSARFVLFRGPGISRRVLGFFSGGGGRGRICAGAVGTCSSARRGRKCRDSDAVAAGWPGSSESRCRRKCGEEGPGSLAGVRVRSGTLLEGVVRSPGTGLPAQTLWGPRACPPRTSSRKREIS